MTCPWCKGPIRFSSCSYFTSQDICEKCKEDEKHCPNYQRAREEEGRAVRAGNYNFPGIGLTVEDIATLARRLGDRK